MTEQEWKSFSVPPESELRIILKQGQSGIVKVTNGCAESFGTELAPNTEYTFDSCNVSIFTWQGCQLDVTASIGGDCYVSDETPMMWYANASLVLQERRERALTQKTPGPRVMLVGGTNVGKSTQARILLNYAARLGQMPTFMDLDVGQGSITVPGCVAAVTLMRPLEVTERSFSEIGSPVVSFFGAVTPSENLELYKQCVENLVRMTDKRFANHAKVAAAGCVINTCGWVDGDGYELILSCRALTRAETIIVIDNELLYSKLQGEFQANEAIDVLKVAKSGGTVSRDASVRAKARSTAIHKYFYGEEGDFHPMRTTLDYDRLRVYSIGGGSLAPSSALPIGAERLLQATTALPIEIDESILNSVAAVSYAKSEEELTSANVAGFIHIAELNTAKRKVTILAPCAGPLPGITADGGTGDSKSSQAFVLVSVLKWVD